MQTISIVLQEKNASWDSNPTAMKAYQNSKTNHNNVNKNHINYEKK